MSELFHEVEIVERTEITKEGRVQKVYRVSAYTKSDIRFSVDIREADFTKDKVAEVLSQKARELEEIKAL